MLELLLVLVLIGAIVWLWRALRETTPRVLPWESDEDHDIDLPWESDDYDTTIRAAIQRRGRLWLRYGDAEGVISERYVAPYSWDGRILGAYCFGVQAPRKFRVDRIMELR